MGTPIGSLSSDPAAAKARLTGRARLVLAGVALLALLIKILLALKTYGTNDVYVFDHFSVWSRYLGVSLYRADAQLNHPPSMIYVLHFLSRLAGATGLPFPFWLRLTDILADTGTLWMVWKLLGERVRERSIFWALVLLAGSPTLIMISGFHGNTDSVVIFFVLLSIYLIETGASGWRAGAAFGLACCVKVFPAIVVPVILLNVSGEKRLINQRWIKFCAAAVAVLAMCWSPFLFQDPKAVLGQVFGYRSLYGRWGLSYLALQLEDTLARVLPGSMAWMEALNTDYERLGSYLALGLVFIVSWRMNRGSLRSPWQKSRQAESLSHRACKLLMPHGRTGGFACRFGCAGLLPRAVRPRLFSQAGLVFLLFLSVSNGFGVQYLAWLAPWVVELGWAPAAIFYAASSVFLFLVYNYWAQGLPWYLADSINVGEFAGYFDHAQIICWLSVVVAAALAWRNIGIAAGWKRILPFPPLAPGWRIAGALLAAVAVYAIVPTQMDTPAPPGDKDEHAVRAIQARSDLDLALLLADSRRYEDSIRAAREALALTPDSAEAYAGIASGDAALGRWREAGENAERALRLDPDFQAARTVLALAASRK